VEKKKLVLRSGAKNGDLIFVTGALGGSIKKRHLNFMPRVREAREILKHFKINSMIDISDGLALDLNRILEASGVGAVIYENAIPLSRDAASINGALYDGEDYELLFTSSEGNRDRIASLSKALGLRITPIGRITGGKRLKVIDKEGRPYRLKSPGFEHF
ncbi:MAG: AIR synthase-related protein, partial [Deltaproteobacteria bacterium]|nr:AIR synthase-related protein [Deltaproteobacteria bacterium]